MIYSILIFRDSKVVHFEDFQQSTEAQQSLLSFSPKSGPEVSHDHHLLMGMLSAASGIASMLSPGENLNRFESLSTPEYRLDFFETPTGYKFVVLSAPNPSVSRADVRAEFERLYSLLFVPLVVRNPLFDPTQLTGNLRSSHCHVFVDELRNHFQSLTRKQPADPADHSQAPQVMRHTLSQPSLI